MIDSLCDQLAAALADEVLEAAADHPLDPLATDGAGLDPMRDILLRAILPLVAQREQQLREQIATLETRLSVALEGSRDDADEPMFGQNLRDTIRAIRGKD